jgi:hypothetical protein
MLFTDYKRQATRRDHSFYVEELAMLPLSNTARENTR